MRLTVEHIAVEPSGITVETRLEPSSARITAQQAQRALELLPNLARHVCVNDKGETFGAEISGTEPAHLFEHVVIELMAQEHGGDGAGLMGHTAFTSERGLMETKITFRDDIVALVCIKRACWFVNEL